MWWVGGTQTEPASRLQRRRLDSSDICDVKFVLRRRECKTEEDVVADIVRAHNVVVVRHSRSPVLKDAYEKNKDHRDFEFCVRIEVEVSVADLGRLWAQTISFMQMS